MSRLNAELTVSFALRNAEDNDCFLTSYLDYASAMLLGVPASREVPLHLQAQLESAQIGV